MQRYLHRELLLLHLLLLCRSLNGILLVTGVFFLIKVEDECLMPDGDLLIVATTLALDGFLVGIWIGTFGTVEYDLPIDHNEVLGCIFTDNLEPLHIFLLLLRFK